MTSIDDRAPDDVLVRGDAVPHWFAEREQRFDARSAPPQLFADELAAGAFGAVRLWHTAGTVHARPVEGDLLRLVLQVEGEVVLETGSASESIELRAGSIAVLPPLAAPVLRADRPTARVELRFEAPATLRTLVASEHPHVYSGTTPFFAIVISTVNAALNAGMSSADPGFAHLRSATENLGVALVLSCFGGDVQGGSREAELYSRALACIARDAARPELTVEVLARELAVSRRYLTRAFTAQGTTARDEIRRARLRLAREQLDRADGEGVAEIARRTGFGSPRRLREALGR